MAGEDSTRLSLALRRALPAQMAVLLDEQHRPPCQRQHHQHHPETVRHPAQDAVVIEQPQAPQDIFPVVDSQAISWW